MDASGIVLKSGNDKLAVETEFVSTAHASNKVYSWFIGIIILVAGLTSAWGGFHSFSGDNANSRLATLYSLVHLQTWYLDTEDGAEKVNPFEALTIDKVQVGGRVLSSKPPVLPFMMTGVYGVIHFVMGKSLAEPNDLDSIVGMLVFVFTTLPFLLSLILMYRILSILEVTEACKSICLFAQALCSGAWVYSATLNNHVPAMACLVVALYGTLLIRREGIGAPLRFGWIGLAGGLAIAIDVPAGAFVAGMGIILLPYLTLHKGIALAVGGLLPLLVHGWILYGLTGSILPVQMHTEWYQHESSYWRNPLGMDALNPSHLGYLFDFTFGRHGFFMTYPIMFVGLMGLIGGAVMGKIDYRRGIWVGLCGLLAIVGYYALKTNNFGGEAFGTRWLLITTPFFVLGLAGFLSHYHRRWQYGLVGVILLISLASAMHGHKAPWASDREWPVQLYGTSLNTD